MAQRADVFVENFKKGDLERYGLHYERIAESNPRLVYASITGFGQDGPRAAEPIFDAALQGLMGIMSVTGEPDGPPMRVAVAWIDLLTGPAAAIGILAALHEREWSGQGQQIDLSLFDVVLMSMVNLAQSYLVTGAASERLGNAHAHIVPYQAFESQDGWFVLAVGNDDQFRRMAQAAGPPGLSEDDRFRTNAARVEHRKELVSELAALFQGRKRGKWLSVMGRAKVPAAPVNTVAEATQEPQAQARHAVWVLDHPSIGDLPSLANALQHMSRTPVTPQGHPPLLGEHTRDVLTDALGLGPAEMANLESSGIVLSVTRQAGNARSTR